MDGALANFPLTWFWLLQLCFVFLPHPLAFWKKKQSKLVPKVVFFVLWTHIWEEPLQGSISEANLTKSPTLFRDPCLLHFQKMCSVFLRYFFGRSTSRDWGISRSQKASILGPKCIPKFDMPDLQICCYLLHFDTIWPPKQHQNRFRFCFENNLQICYCKMSIWMDFERLSRTLFEYFLTYLACFEKCYFSEPPCREWRRVKMVSPGSSKKLLSWS